MSGELIIRFRAGVPEDEARTRVEALGCTIRRRMRDDSPDIVTLLARGTDDAVARARSVLSSDPKVDLVEDNAGGYRALD